MRLLDPKTVKARATLMAHLAELLAKAKKEFDAK